MATKLSEAALKKYRDEFEKSFGAGALRVPTKNIYEVISTGSLALDRAMGCGGFIRGRITEVWGPESGGKTSLTLISAGIAQKIYPGEFVGFIDVEQTFDAEWAQTLGVNLKKLHVVTPATAEDVADIMKSMLESGMYSMIILDSVGAMLPKEEFEKDADKVSMGTIAKIITRMVKIAAVYASRYSVSVVVINQVRANLGFGGDTTTGGGFALKHVSTHKLQVKRGSGAYTVGSDDNKVNVGFTMAVKVQKNKVAPEGRTVQFDFYTKTTSKYGPVGVNQAQDVFSAGVSSQVIKQKGSYYILPGGERINGKDSVLDHLKETPLELEAIRKGVLDLASSEVVSDEPLTPQEVEAIPE